MSQLLESRLTPQQRAQACAADAAEMAAETAMSNLRAAQAARVTLQTAARAIDAANRPGFEAITGIACAPQLLCDCCDDEEMTQEDAHSEATDQLLSYAESVADWIAQACDTDAGRMPLDVSVLSAVQVIEGTPATLLAVLMTGDNTQVLRAIYQLRTLAGKHFAADINERAADLLSEAL